MRRAVQAVLVLVGIWLAPAASAHAAPAETGRYYVVGPPVDGQREYLYAIAVRTLGNGNRYREIVGLNIGRAQPDGEMFTDGLTLNPGWVLVLPRDARGQGVRVGPLPRTGGRTTPPVARTPAAERSTPPPTAAAPARTTGAPTRVPPSTPARPPATAQAAAPPPQRSTTLDGANPLVIRLGAGVLSVLLVVAAIVLLRPLRSGRRLSVVGDDGPWPPERHHTPAPADRAPGAPALSDDTTTPLEPAAPTPPAVTAASPTDRATVSPAGGGSTSAFVEGTTSSLAESAPASDRPVAPPEGSAPDTPRPPLPGGNEAPYLTADLDTDVGPARVRLVGVAAGRGVPPYAWLGPEDAAPPAVLPLVLGRSGPWRLHVDLARVPDVLTLVGPVDICGRAAAMLAGSLSAAGVGVAVVGDALGAQPPVGFRRLPGLPDPPGPGGKLPEPCVVFTAGPPPAGARGLAAATGGRCVPVVLGPVPAGRWSLQLDVDADPVGAD